MEGKLQRLWREPLLHFLLIGAGLFLLFDLQQEQANEAPNQIVVSSGQIEQLRGQFKRTWLRPPTATELDALIDAYIREEVYYREALALGLDRDDPQVRQRMRMKMQFLLEDLTAAETPSDELLGVYMQEHPEKFYREPQVSFQQVYLNPGKRQDLVADAQALLAHLKSGVATASLGDHTLLQDRFTLSSQSDIARSFGEDFAKQVVAMAPGEWSEPLVSQLGVHLVRVDERRAGRLPELTEVRAQVEREYLAQHRKERQERAYQELRAAYEVVIEAEPINNASDIAMLARPAEEAK